MISSAVWSDWLAGQEQQTLKSFLAQPVHAFSMYQSELATSKDYHGREILELLQNAADQAQLAGSRGRVHLELNQDFLIVANTGSTFTQKGVISLQNPHISAKRNPKGNAKLVGNKGLGFRSILNWTNSPLVISGELRLAYSKDKLASIEKDLREGSEEYARELFDQFPESDSPKLPLLPFPIYASHDDDLDLSSYNAGLVKRCEQLVSDEGYDTALGMPFKHAHCYPSVIEQLKHLKVETLLFVDWLSQITKVIEDKETTLTKRTRGNQVWLSKDGEQHSSWNIFSSKGEIPPESLDEHQNNKEYELTIAVPRGDIRDFDTGYLYSYFSTQVELPIRARCHASLDLDQSRNHLNESDANRFVIEKLGEFLAESVEKSANENICNPAYLLAKPKRDVGNDPHLSIFFKSLIESLADKKFVPTIDGKILKPDDCLGITNAYAKWLPPRCFPDVIETLHESDNDFFKEVGVVFLDKNELLDRLIQLTDLSVDERANLIWGVKNYLSDLAHPALLTGNSDIPEEARVFTFTEQMTDLAVPEWAKLFVLEEALKEKLLSIFDLEEQRELQQQLNEFGLREFSVSRLIENVVAEANRSTKMLKSKSSIRQINTELVQFLSTVFDKNRHDNLIEFPAVSVPLLTQKGFKNAKDLYLGKHYGSRGAILQGLYGSVDRGVFVADPKRLILAIDDSCAADFLIWIGVADRPRIEKTNKFGGDYVTTAANSLSYPVRFEEYVVEDVQEFSRARFRDVRSLFKLDELLNSGRYEAILAWLVTDSHLTELGETSKDNAKVSTIQNSDRKQRYFSESLPSYIKWKVQNTAWVLGTDGTRHAPIDCVFGSALNETLFPKPKIPSERVLSRYGIERPSLMTAFRFAGVITSLDELNSDQFYEKLMRLPEADSEGKTARSMYVSALDNDIITGSENDPARRKFLDGERMWGCRAGTYEYFQRKDLLYVDSEGIPDALIDRLAIVDLPKKKGAKKVENLFEIQPISKATLKQTVSNHTPSNDPTDDFEQCKPFFYLLRTEPKNIELERLRDLELVLCDQVKCKFEYDAFSLVTELDTWQWVIDGSKLFVAVDPKIGVIDELVSESIGSAIASIFGLAGGDEFARMYQCRPEHRRAVLGHIRGEEAVENIEDVFSTLEIYQESGVTEDSDFSIDDPDISTSAPQETEEKSAEAQESNTADKESFKQIDVTKLDTEKKEAKREITLSVRKITETRRNRRIHQVTDSELCENLAYQFEANEGRFPLRVGHVVGKQGFGCDILSFNDDDSRNRFRENRSRDSVKVERYIEVKGRKSGSSDVELKGNELLAAKQHKEKYFIYRLFKLDGDSYELGILSAPTQRRDVIQEAVYVDLIRSDKTERYRLSSASQSSQSNTLEDQKHE